MLFNLNNIPIKYKLILSIYAVLFAIITASFGIVINQEVKNKYNELVIEAKVFNRFFSQDFVAVVTIGDIDKATDVISRLRTLNKVEGLTIYNAERKAVFYYKHENIKKLFDLPKNWQSQYEYIKDSMLLLEPLEYRGGNYGYVFVQLSTKEINEILSRKIQQAAIILFVLLLASLVLAWMIQRYFTNPINLLVLALRKSAETLDYSARLPEKRKDEIGDLFRGFNNLQDKIEEEKKSLHDQQFAFDQHCIVGIIDPKGIIVYANDFFVNISGYSKDELIGQNNRILKSSFHNDDFFKKIHKCIGGGEIWSGDICHKAKDGHEYWVATTIVPFMGESQKPLSFMVMQTDITVQNTAEANLARAQRMVNIGSWELDLIRDDLHWSAEIYRIFEINPNDFSPTYESFLEVIHPEDRSIVNQAYEKSLKLQQPYEIEHRILMKDGRIKIVKEQCETYFDESGKALRSIGVVHDITNSKRTEEALRRSQKMDAVGQLTGGIAHDFNNIMGIILGNIELLELLNITDTKIINRLDPIKISAQRAAKLTKQLLSFSRRKAQQLISVDTNNLLVNMKSLIEHSVTPEIEVSYQLSENLWLIKIDPGDFQDAILNIIINARFAMNNNGYLSVETNNIYRDKNYCSQNPDAVEGEYVQVIISDNGKGIAAEHLQRIFEPFYTTKVEGSGTGLGLAMVFGFVERSKGHIKVYSEINVGSSFEIYLPRSFEEGKGLEHSEKQRPKFIPKGNETILVVDDEEGLRELARDSLQILGYKVLVAADGNQAIKILETHPQINLIFSDVVMPGGINGYELAEFVEKNYPHLKILLTSGYTQKAIDKNGSLLYEGSKFESDLLHKPYSRDALAHKIREMLD